MSAALREMVSLLEQLLSERASHHRAAVSIYSVAEVLAGQADPGSLPVLELPFVDVVPLVHNLLANSAFVLQHELAVGQGI